MKLIKKIPLFFLVISICSFAMAKDLDGVFGMFRVELHDKAGTFTLSVLDSNSDKFKPILNPLDNSSGTLLYLKAGSKVYPLSKLGGVPVIQNMTESSATITYNIKNIAEVNLIFSFVSSETGTFTETADLVVVDVLVKNISKKTRVYSLRGVFDTFLGENSSVHFSTNTMKALNSEALFNSMYNDKWIKSSDGNNSIKFLLDGDTITRPASVVVANRDVLSVDSWEPKIVPGRGFNSLFSLNNSAVGITWSSYKIAPQKLFGIRFYISGATNLEEPADTNSFFFTSGKALQSASFVHESDKLVAEEVIEYVVLSTKDEDENDTSEEIIVEEEPIDTTNESSDDVSEELPTDEEIPVEEFIEDENLEEFPLEDEVELDDAEEVADGNLPYVEITPEKLNLEYVEELIKEIEELEQNPEMYDAGRILYLHTELDAILKILEE